MNVNKKIIQNILWLGIEKCALILLIMFAESMISRALGVVDYGKWLYGVNIIIMFSSLSLLAGAEVMVPALVRYKRLSSELLTAALLIRLAASFLTLVVIYIYSKLFIDDLVLIKMLLWLSLSLIFNEPFMVIVNFFQAKTEIRNIVFIRVVAAFFRCAVVALAVYICNKVDLIYITRFIESLITAVLLLILVYYKDVKFIYNKKVLYSVFSRGLVFWLPLILMYVYFRMDRIFIEYFLDYHVVAQYGVALQFIEQGCLLLLIVVQSISPLYIFSRADRFLNKLFFKIMLMISLCALLVQLSGFLFLRKIILLIFGVEYGYATDLAIEMLPAILFYGIDSVLMVYLYRDKAAKLVLVKWVIMSIITVMIYYLWYVALSRREPAIIYNLCMMIMMSISFMLCIYHNSKMNANRINSI